MFQLDEIDRKLLKELLMNSNRSQRELAKAIGVSTATVINHIQRLESAGVIKDYTVMLDYERLGYELTANVEMTFSRGKLIEVEKAVSKLPYVCAVYDITGEIDAIIVAKFRNRQELSEFPKALLGMSDIQRTNTHVVLNTIKEDFRMSENLK
ncbi:MAG: Lrp/AsnC family transcriptional regulator [Candidatus Bathyarchaeota archaeon]|nr:Lrp/AsnC family transcriptional regulator [Candidatus Bathyarchaeota archaeon]